MNAGEIHSGVVVFEIEDKDLLRDKNTYYKNLEKKWSKEFVGWVQDKLASGRRGDGRK